MASPTTIESPVTSAPGALPAPGTSAPGAAPERTSAPCAAPARGRRGSWPLERILFLMAGTMTAVSALLAALVSPWFLLLTGFVALNQLAFATLGNCPSSWLMRRYLGVKGAGES